MKIAYVTTYNASDVHQWSGLGFHIAKALQDQDNEIEYAGDLRMKYRKLLKAKQYFYKALGYRYQRERERFIARDYAAQVLSKISASSDIVLSPGTIPIAYLKTKKPKVFYTDASFAGILGFYPVFTNLSPETIRSGNEIEQMALSSCSLAIYASDWAAQTAITHYQADPQKIKVVPFGANIECDRTTEDIKMLIRKRPRSTCKLLFLGVDWERKGGALAVGVMQALNKTGLNTELHVAGIKTMPYEKLPDQVIDHGFISKSTREGRDKISRLLSESHFLILPTRAESFGIVFCEANSFGVPNIATLTGGVPTAVRDGVSGKLFSLAAQADEYASYIYRLFEDYQAYEELALSSFNEYQQRLNWKVSGKKIMDLIREI